jgi:hypothetical protein
MTIANSGISGEITWTQTKTNTGFLVTRQGPDKIELGLAPAIATYNEVYAVQGTLAGSATVTLNLNSFSNLLGQAVTATKGIGLMVKATAADLKIEPGATNPLAWFWGGTTPSVTIKAGGFFLIGDGGTATISASTCNLKITNLSGSITATYSVAFLGGT